MANFESIVSALTLLEKHNREKLEGIMAELALLGNLIDAVHAMEAELAEQNIQLDSVRDWEDVLQEELPPFDLFSTENVKNMEINIYLDLRYKSKIQEMKDAMDIFIKYKTKIKEWISTKMTPNPITLRRISPKFVTPPKVSNTEKTSDAMETEAMITASQTEELCLGPSSSSTANRAAEAIKPPAEHIENQPEDIFVGPSTSLNAERAATSSAISTKGKRRRQPTHDCFYRSLNGIDTPPKFIDGDGTVKHVNVSKIDTSNGKKGKNKQSVQRFGSTDEIDTVILGIHGTTVSKSALNDINWSAKASLCIRNVLLTVFDRTTLGVSTLSGLESPAYKGIPKPTKVPLDTLKVDDITEFMLEQLPVTRKEVRQTIVNKCADETKFLRKQQMAKSDNSDEFSQQDNAGINDGVTDANSDVNSVEDNKSEFCGWSSDGLSFEDDVNENKQPLRKKIKFEV